MRGEEFDVAVLGAGPAGLATALALRRSSNLRVVVLERSSCPPIRVGEILPPSVIEPLSALGLWQDFLASRPLPSAGVAAWWSGGRVDWDYIRVPFGSGWHVDRPAFNRLLEGACLATGVAVMRGWNAMGVTASSSGVEVTARNGAASLIRVSSRTVVDARGRSAPALMPLQRRHKLDRLIGVSRHFAQTGSLDDVEPRLWVEATRNGWWYSAPLPGGRMIATYMTDADCIGRPVRGFFDSCLQEAHHTHARLRLGAALSPITVSAAHSCTAAAFVLGNVLTAGDAAYATDPARGHGILNALRHGLLAAETILRRDAGDRSASDDFAHRLQSGWTNYVAGLAQHYSAAVRWAHEPFWRRRAPRV